MDYKRDFNNDFNTLLNGEETETDLDNVFIKDNSGSLLLSANQTNGLKCLHSNQNSNDDILVNTGSQIIEYYFFEDLNTESVTSIVTTPSSSRETAVPTTNGINNSNKISNDFQGNSKRKLKIKGKCSQTPSSMSYEKEESECAATSEADNSVTSGRGRGRPSLNRSEEEKRAKTLETNKKSAKGYRSKKKLKESELSETIENFENENLILKKKIEEMKRQKEKYFQLVLSHTTLSRQMVEQKLKENQ